MEKINCVLVDDDAGAVDRMEQLLRYSGFSFAVSKICDPVKAVKFIQDKRPDLVFIDVEMPKVTGFQIVRQVKASLFFPTFIFMTDFDQYAIRAIKEEVFDYLLKPIDLDELRECLDRYINKQRKLYIPYDSYLTKREKEILELVVEGKTSREIGEILHLSKHTVDTHRRNILGKTGKSS